MAFRNIYIENNVKISIKNEQLIITKDEEDNSIPLEDINCICVDNLYCSLTSYTLSKFVEYNIVLYLCNRQHLPNGILLGTNKYSRQLKNLSMQLDLPKPLQKRLWQDIIKQKISNQSLCLKKLEIPEYKLIENMALEVTSGDSTNIEAKAAALYFKLLFGSRFNRNLDCIQNGALNYGYAIVRGMICRTLVTYGFETSIGLFHHNQLNNFNLADDLLECFRPLVDLYVIKNINLDDNELDSNTKKELFNIINHLVLIDNKKFNVQNAIDHMISSLSTSMNKGENLLSLPVLISLERYRYA